MIMWINVTFVLQEISSSKRNLCVQWFNECDWFKGHSVDVVDLLLVFAPVASFSWVELDIRVLHRASVRARLDL